MTDADQPVPLRDLQVALRVAAGAREGGRAEREPTLEQLLAAFGETEPTPEARRRARAALESARVTVLPDLLEAPPGARVRLLPAAGSKGGPSPAARAAAGVAALLTLLLVAVVGASALSGSSDDPAVGDALPAGTTATTPPAVASTPTVATSPPAQTTPTAPTTTPADAADEAAAEERAAARRRSERRAAERRRRERAAARRPITVRLIPAEPTYLCADRGPGTSPIFAGTLSGRRTFRGNRIRLNVGLGSTRVLVNGKRVPLRGSPAGLDLTRKAQRPLGTGARPSC